MKSKFVSVLAFVLAYFVVKYAVLEAGAFLRDSARTPEERSMSAAMDGLSNTEKAQLNAVLDRAGADTPEEAEAVTARLAAAGLLRLSDETLRRRAAIMAGVLSDQSVEVCGRMARGEMSSGSELAELFGDPERIRSMTKIGLLAALAEARGSPAARPVSDADAEAAFVALFQLQTPEDAMRLESILADYETAAPVDACWAGITLFESVAQLPEPEASHLARLLAMQ